MRAGLVLALGAAALSVAAWQPTEPIPLGFTAAGAAAHRSVERRFLASPSAARIRDAHKYLAARPHLAGSDRDRELADWTQKAFESYGLEDVQITTHEVLLPWPLEVRVEMNRTGAAGAGWWSASMQEEPVAGDEYTQIPAADAGIPYHAYSASGTATAPVVYAGSGNPADYDALARRGVDIKGKIALVRYSVPYSYRGFKALTAQRRGAAGILIYSDSEDDGAGKGAVYPKGPWGPESHIQRGGIVYDFMVPGDPLTPGWASLPGAKRIEAAAATSLPTIISAPLSFKDAKVILEALGSPHRKKDWTPPAELPTVRMTVRADDRIRPIWTVTGMIRGSEKPDELVILGNHRDAWIYGGVDPSSGSAAMMELARTLGALVRGGWRPRRSILFASWDAEEFTLTSSTEWGEQHEERLRKSAVAYLNVDSAASGPHFSAAAVPALNALIAEAAGLVRDPRTRTPIAAVSRARKASERGSLSTGEGAELVNNRLGSGSDYTVFLNFVGMPIADLSFDGPYGVYHSIYDNHHWVARIGDPGFRYHVALVQLWGIMALRLASADVIPLDYQPYAATIKTFAREVEKRRPGQSFESAALAADDFERAAVAFNARRRTLLASDRPAPGDMDELNGRLLGVERALLDPAGIPGRPWYRHQVYAPKFTYAPELLPGVAEAVEANDPGRVDRQLMALAAALDRATRSLGGRPRARIVPDPVR